MAERHMVPVRRHQRKRIGRSMVFAKLQLISPLRLAFPVRNGTLVTFDSNYIPIKETCQLMALERRLLLSGTKPNKFFEIIKWGLLAAIVICLLLVLAIPHKLRLIKTFIKLVGKCIKLILLVIMVGNQIDFKIHKMLCQHCQYTMAAKGGKTD